MVATTQDERRDLPIGMDVYTADFHRLGIVTQADVNTLVVEEWLFSPHTYTLKLSEVDRYEDGDVVLSLGLDQVAQESDGIQSGPATGGNT